MWRVTRYILKMDQYEYISVKRNLHTRQLTMIWNTTTLISHQTVLLYLRIGTYVRPSCDKVYYIVVDVFHTQDSASFLDCFIPEYVLVKSLTVNNCLQDNSIPRHFTRERVKITILLLAKLEDIAAYISVEYICTELLIGYWHNYSHGS